LKLVSARESDVLARLFGFVGMPASPMRGDVFVALARPGLAEQERKRRQMPLRVAAQPEPKLVTRPLLPGTPCPTGRGALSMRLDRWSVIGLLGKDNCRLACHLQKQLHPRPSAKRSLEVIRSWPCPQPVLMRTSGSAKAPELRIEGDLRLLEQLCVGSPRDFSR